MDNPQMLYGIPNPEPELPIIFEILPKIIFYGAIPIVILIGLFIYLRKKGKKQEKKK